MVKRIDKRNASEMKTVKISPSILSVSIEDIPQKIKNIEENIDYIHIDVMDGKFVSNKTSGIEMFEKAKDASKKLLDVHLMVENPLAEVENYKGSHIITFHIEAVKDENEALKIIDKIHSFNAIAGISIKPNTKIDTLIKLIEKIDLILIMSVEPGYGGQKLIPDVLEKIRELRSIGFTKLIEIDGGVTIENVNKIKDYDVDIIVAGTAIFSAEDEKEAILEIKKPIV